MAKSRKTTDQPEDAGSAEQQAERMAGSVGGSAHQIWLAGVGALGRAQVEGSRLFENLVREGSSMEGHARRFADQQAAAAKTVIESGVDSARHQASGTWERLEKSFEERVRRTMDKYGVPSRDDLASLSRRVDALTAEVRERDAQRAPGRKAPSSRAAPKKTSTRSRAASPTHPAAKKTGAKAAPAKKATASKTTPGKRAGKPQSRR